MSPRSTDLKVVLMKAVFQTVERLSTADTSKLSDACSVNGTSAVTSLDM